MNLRAQIANFVTLLNGACGFLAVIFIINDHVILACYLVILGGFFDFIDGLVARALGISSELGKQLDSLSDMVTFGVVPGLIAYTLLNDSITNSDAFNSFPHLIYITVLIPLFSGYRLGKFNIDTRQTTSFLGLPTPANGIFWISLHLILQNDKYAFGDILHHPVVLVVLVIVTSILLVVELPLFGFKFKSYRWRDNKMKYTFIILSLLMLAFLGFAAVPIILILYIIFSIVNNSITKNNETPM